MILIRFRYDLLVWIVSGVVLQLWCWYGFRYDFDMVSVMTLDVGQNFDLKPTHRNHIQNRIKTISKSYHNRIKIVSKPYQNRIKIVSKSYQRRIKIVDRPKTCLGAVSVSFLEANPSGTKVHPRGIRLSYSNWTIVALFVCPLRLAADEPIT